MADDLLFGVAVPDQLRTVNRHALEVSPIAQGVGFDGCNLVFTLGNLNLLGCLDPMYWLRLWQSGRPVHLGLSSYKYGRAKVRGGPGNFSMCGSFKREL
jgi:hypothetical protein